MRLVLTTIFDHDDTEFAEANIRFHLNAGVDVVLAAADDDRVAEALRSFGARVLVE